MSSVIDSASSGMLEGLPWLRDFFRREAAESKVEGEHRETAEDTPLDSEQREKGVKRCGENNFNKKVPETTPYSFIERVRTSRGISLYVP